MLDYRSKIKLFTKIISNDLAILTSCKKMWWILHCQVPIITAIFQIRHGFQSSIVLQNIFWLQICIYPDKISTDSFSVVPWYDLLALSRILLIAKVIK